MSKVWLTRNPFSTGPRTDAVSPLGRDSQSAADDVSFDAAESGRHRGVALVKHPATLVTASITAASLALAGYAAYGPTGMTSDQVADSFVDGAPTLADSATDGLEGPASLARISDRSQTMDQAVSGVTSGQSSREAGAEGSAVLSERVEEIEAEEKAAEAKAAEEAEAAAEAEREAQAQAAAEADAAEEAEAQAEADSAAVQEREESQAASRSQERESAAVEAPAEPEPEPEPEAAAEAPAEAPAEPAAPAPSGDARSIARSMVSSYGWSGEQFGCLESLWAKESGWNHTASNPSSGAYGIPQSLPGSKMASAGSDWRTNPATQIEWGLGYIKGRYGSPCAAWSHSQANNWY